jgi:hypothetical protein
MRKTLVRASSVAVASLVASLLSASPSRAADETGVTELTSAPSDAFVCSPQLATARSEGTIEAKIELADCYARAGKTASAYAEYRATHELASKIGDKRGREARDRADALESHLSKLIVILDGPAQVKGMQIFRDGVAMDATELGRWTPVDPGMHTILVTAPERKPWERRVRIAAEGGTESVTVPVLHDDGDSSAPVDPVTREGRTQRTVGLILGGAGVAALGVGALFGLRANAKLDESNANGHCKDNNCDAFGLELRSQQHTAATTATVSFIAGAVALGTGAAVFFTAPSGAPVRRVGVTPVGPQGAGVTVGGIF